MNAYQEALLRIIELEDRNAELLEALEMNNTLLLSMSKEFVIREDWRATYVADQIRDNYRTISKAKPNHIEELVGGLKRAADLFDEIQRHKGE